MARKVRGIFERPAGSGDWWIRYHDQHGREHREKVGRRSAAIAAYQKRKTGIREGRFFPEQLRHRAGVSFAQIANDALLYAERHKGRRSAREDRWKMARLHDWFGDRDITAITFAGRGDDAGSTGRFRRRESAISAIMTCGIRLLPCW